MLLVKHLPPPTINKVWDVKVKPEKMQTTHGIVKTNWKCNAKGKMSWETDKWQIESSRTEVGNKLVG